MLGCSPGSGCWTTEAGSSSAPVSPGRRVMRVERDWSIAGSDTLFHSTSGRTVRETQSVSGTRNFTLYRLDSWVLLTVLVIFGELSHSQSDLATLDQVTRVITPEDFQHAEDPVTQLMLVTDQGRALLRDNRFFQRTHNF